MVSSARWDAFTTTAYAGQGCSCWAWSWAWRRSCVHQADVLHAVKCHPHLLAHWRSALARPPRQSSTAALRLPAAGCQQRTSRGARCVKQLTPTMLDRMPDRMPDSGEHAWNDQWNHFPRSGSSVIVFFEFKTYPTLILAGGWDFC